MLLPRAIPAALICLLCGCAGQVVPDRPDTPAGARSPAPPASAAPSADTVQRLAAARARVALARRTLTGFTDADASLAQAEAAASAGNNPRAQSLARQAEARADYALQTHYTRKAAAELQALYATTGLDDTQLGQLRAAEAALIRGDSLIALNRLQGLRKQASTASRSYTVARGETLSGIAARADVYGNSLLWPLIWEANKATLANPDRLRAGQVLKIRPSPSVDEVVKAIEYARNNPAARLKVGPVVPVQP